MNGPHPPGERPRLVRVRAGAITGIHQTMSRATGRHPASQEFLAER